MTTSDMIMQDQADHVALCLGVKVPPSPFLNDTRIERINAARYEGQEIKGALHVVREGDTVLEMGAGIGIVGAVIAHNAKPAKVLSYEANPALIPHIEALYALNGLEDTISVTNRVLLSAPDRPKKMTLHVTNSYLGSSLIQRKNRATRAVEVDTDGFNEICTNARPSVLIMDIEGGELDILRDADLSGIRAIVMEFHPEAYGVEGMRTCKQILRDAGFARVEDCSTRLVWTCQRAEADQA